MEYKALSTVPCTQIELRKHSCGYNNNVNRIDPGLLVVFHCPLKLSLPLKEGPHLQTAHYPQRHSCSALPAHSRLWLPQALLGLFSLKFHSQDLEEMIPLEQGRICIHIAKQPVPIQLPTASWDEPQHSERASWGAPRCNQGCGRREPRRRVH